MIVFEAHAEKRLAVALLQPGRRAAAGQGRDEASAAAIAVAQKPLLVDELLQLQLEHAGAPNLGGGGVIIAINGGEQSGGRDKM